MGLCSYKHFLDGLRYGHIYHACGASFSQTFTLTLDEALRAGAIVRGMDLDESEVLKAEQIAPQVRNLILRSGDERLVRILKVLPDESWARLRDILTVESSVVP